MAFSKDAARVYVQTREGNDAFCLGEQAMEAKAARTLACHPRADLDRVYFSADGDVPVAAVFEQGVPEIAWLNPEHPDTKLLKGLSASFPGQLVEPTSWSDDGSKVVFVVRSDRNPGEYYLYDRKAGTARFLLAQRPWIDPAKMAQVKALTVKSRSGAHVYAYVTLPPGKAASRLPMVVMPPGGPMGPRDRWEWDSDAQFFASRGYAVLQVNFHGSGGYGYKYQEAGRGVWGTLLINDITDAVRATIAAGTADPDRICIYGGSYGGYASLMSAAREPDLYQCAIPYVGVFDLAMLKRDTDMAQVRQGRAFMDMYIGDDPKVLAEHSPINYLDTLRAPIFIVHGEKDPRAPFNQAKLLRAKLEERKHPYEWLSKPKEGHGFYNVDNRTELYEKMEDFLDRHIGERRPAKTQPSRVQ
jgi:dipeptidyl aminopeptidase/acylaminoacyl peptidase